MRTYTKNIIPAVGSLALANPPSQAAGRVKKALRTSVLGAFCVRPYSLRLAEDDPGRSCSTASVDGVTISTDISRSSTGGIAAKGQRGAMAQSVQQAAGYPSTV